jgi:succinyl-CoA synthetase alpha subunit
VVLTSRVRQNTYVDSVALMQTTAQIQAFPGVVAAALVMATDLNRELLAHAGLLAPDMKNAGANDLVLAVRAESSEAAQAALNRAEELLGARRGGEDTSRAELPRSVISAARQVPGVNLAVISVPGRYAAMEAHQALSAGLHVFRFSDHVPLAHEIALKRRAWERGLLFMGPECGTSIINGVGLGFANTVRRGGVGLVGASGTGLQEVSSLIHRLGGGISHVIGTGARDLQDAVGGLTTLRALEWLAADRGTRAVILVSKPPSSAIAETVLKAAAATGKPVVACLLGWGGATPPGVRAVATLEEAARAAVEATGGTPARLDLPDRLGASRRVPGRVLGLYTGGTLSEEAQAIVGLDGHRFTDFGASEYTRGRPHPMIDPSLRNAATAAAGDDGSVAVLLVDVVLGHCAHPDPAGALAVAVREARARAEQAGRTLDVVAHVVGTDQDPQGLAAQEEALRALGAVVCPSNRLAAKVARELAAGRYAG